MSKIHLLSEDIINKIAAGEVIERPASIVKELMENSLDAGATKITIDIEDSGKRLIRVADNGEGMEQEDAESSILRHATSKINDDADLEAIRTLGFRGEALASIAAVSQLTISTKKKEAMEGVMLLIEGGEIRNSSIVAAEPGTSMEVRNLFFNTPARKKFLKSDQAELRHIIDTAIRYALINPHITIKLVHEGHTLINSPSSADQRNKIASIYGTALAKALLEVHHADGQVQIEGFIAPPSEARNDKNQQDIYVNGRWVRSAEIIQAVYEGYHSMLFVNKHPVVILNIILDPATIDVNVHPAKTEIKFGQKEPVCAAVTQAVRETLQKNNLIPLIEDEEEEIQLALGTSTLPESKPGAKYAFEPSDQTVFAVPEASLPPDYEDSPTITASIPAELPTMDIAAITQRLQPVDLPPNSKFPAMRVLGQIHKTFFVAEILGGVMYIDQHAAHERVLYEQFMKEYLHTEVHIQKLLQGEVVEFSPAEKVLLLEHHKTLQRLGFTIEPFGEHTFVVKTIPMLFGRIQPKEIIYEVLALLREGKNKIIDTKEEIVTRMACRAAVMAGETLTVLEMEHILQDLAKAELPYTCPHGRPTMFKVPVEELEKKFKRKG